MNDRRHRIDSSATAGDPADLLYHPPLERDRYGQEQRVECGQIQSFACDLVCGHEYERLLRGVSSAQSLARIASLCLSLPNPLPEKDALTQLVFDGCFAQLGHYSGDWPNQEWHSDYTTDDLFTAGITGQPRFQWSINGIDVTYDGIRDNSTVQCSWYRRSETGTS